MRRIILIKDKVTMASFGFAFVEFVDVAVAFFIVSRYPPSYFSTVFVCCTCGYDVFDYPPFRF